MIETSSLFERRTTKTERLTNVFHAALEKVATVRYILPYLLSTARWLAQTINDMGVRNFKVKGIGVMILEFFCYLLNAARFGRSLAVVKVITFAFVALTASPIVLKMAQSSFAAKLPVLMVLGDSLVAGHGLPQGEAFPDILGQMLNDDGIDVRIINPGVSGDTPPG